MTIGEHLDELRRCVIRSLIALVVGCLICAYPAKFLLTWTVQPLVVALRRHGQPDSLLATSPTEPFVWYIKVVLFLGLVVASPYVIREIWGFVAKGLYRREKAWAYKLVPASVGLFLLGVAFMYSFVLVLSLNFLIGMGSWLQLPSGEPTLLHQWVGLGLSDPVTTQPADDLLPNLPELTHDPENAKPGDMWFNVHEQRIKIKGSDRTWFMQAERDDHRRMVTTHFKIGDYLTFVLVLAIGFGLAFQVPLVVLFLTRTGILPREVLKKYRKVVILAMFVIAAVLAPPDMLSQFLLAVPMYGLFELGLLISRSKPASEKEA